MEASPDKITKYTETWIEMKRDGRRVGPLWRKVFRTFPRVASPWTPRKEDAKAWMPEKLAA